MPVSVDESTQLIGALRSPNAYRHPVDETQVLETHISWVILTGPFAYKIKKPVDMGFLDFTTLERRKFYCAEELRLNRRLAPDLYLGVVPITGPPHKPRFGGDGNPIEFAVQMRQFPQETLLSHVLERQELTPTHIDALAHQVADFHRRCAVAPADGRFGTWESVWRSMAELFDHLELGDEPEPTAQLLNRWCCEQLQEHKEQLSARRKQGFIRECHGDMHLGNMVLLNGRPMVFDCIEFNEDFRWIDVLSEVAFTTMDLEDRGAPAFARRFLNAYLDETGDYAGLTLMHYYLVYRALVRAKVACLRLRQADVEAEERRHETSKYASYLQLAERYARAPRPSLIITHGLSGSGKTTFTQSLLEAIGAVRVRSDVERKRLFDLKALDRSQAGSAEGIYAPESTQRTYARLAELSGAVLSGGFSVIVDATFLKQEQRERFRRLAAQLKAPFAILDFRASENVLRERIVKRSQLRTDASEADLAILAVQQTCHEPLEASEQRDAIPVDTVQTDALTHAISRLQELCLLITDYDAIPFQTKGA